MSDAKNGEAPAAPAAPAAAAEKPKEAEAAASEAKKEDAAPKAPPVDKAALKEQFEAFAKFGDKTADGKTIKLSQSDKWFKQAKVIDGKKITTTDTGIAFRKTSKNAPKLSFVEWNKYLDEISGQKNVEANAIKAKLVECGKPGLSAGTTSVTRSSVTDRLTDTSRYGGTHKQRFDETGKGRGKAGREDGKGDGYVAGYKHKGTYEAHGGKTKS